MSRNPGVPRYRQIANDILAALQHRAARGGRVPSETEVVRKYGVAKNTARRALDELRRLGYVTRLRGAGSFTTGWRAKTIHALAYFLDGPRFLEMFKWLEHHLGRRGYRLVVGDTGLRGEHLRTGFRLDEIRRSEALIWHAPSHPQGLAAAIAARRKLPKRMPLLCIADPLGLSLQGGHRVDLVHWDYSEAIHRILARWQRQGLRHPILISRTDVTLFSTAEAERAFVADLAALGVPDPASHVVPWEAFSPAPEQQFTSHLQSLPWKPDAYVLQYDWSHVLPAALLPAGPSGPPAIWVFDAATRDKGVKLNFRAMAEVCTDLLINRLENLNRPNLRVALNIPVRRSPSRREG